MTGHAAKAVQQATGMEGGWLTAVRKSTPLQFGVSRGRSEVLFSGYGRGYLSEIMSEFGTKPGPRCREQPGSLVDFHTGSRPSRRTPTVLKVLRGIWAWSGCGRMLLPPNRGLVLRLRKWIGSRKMDPLLWRSRKDWWNWWPKLLNGASRLGRRSRRTRGPIPCDLLERVVPHPAKNGMERRFFVCHFKY